MLPAVTVGPKESTCPVGPRATSAPEGGTVPPSYVKAPFELRVVFGDSLQVRRWNIARSKGVWELGTDLPQIGFSLAVELVTAEGCYESGLIKAATDGVWMTSGRQSAAILWRKVVVA